MHTIRLRGPWLCEVVASGPAVATNHEAVMNRESPRTIRVPVDWKDVIGGHFRGAVIWERKFRCPTGLKPTTKVVLAVADLPAGTSVKLNTAALGMVVEHACEQFDIRRHLQPANQVQIRVPVANDAVAAELSRSQFGDIRLEIEEGWNDEQS